MMDRNVRRLLAAWVIQAARDGFYDYANYRPGGYYGPAEARQWLATDGRVIMSALGMKPSALARGPDVALLRARRR